MEPEILDAPEVLETPEGETPEIVEPTETVDTEKEQLRKEKDELEKKNKQLFERLKKAESPKDDLSSKDVLYLSKADVHEDDLDDVLEMARLKKTSIADAHAFMKPILAARAEERRTANATQTRGSARGSSKISGEDLLASAEKGGDLPDTDEGMAALVAARQARSIAYRKK